MMAHYSGDAVISRVHNSIKHSTLSSAFSGIGHPEQAEHMIEKCFEHFTGLTATMKVLFTIERDARCAEELLLLPALHDPTVDLYSADGPCSFGNIYPVFIINSFGNIYPVICTLRMALAISDDLRGT